MIYRYVLNPLHWAVLFQMSELYHSLSGTQLSENMMMDIWGIPKEPDGTRRLELSFHDNIEIIQLLQWASIEVQNPKFAILASWFQDQTVVYNALHDFRVGLAKRQGLA